jgi:putative protease
VPVLLAPAGNRAAVDAAIDAGADAIYVGLAGWSRGGARGEMDFEEIAQVQRAGRPLHVAINTIPKPSERPRLFDAVAGLLDVGIEDVIVNDAGILATLRRRFPELRVTASIGCGALNAADVAFYRDLGAHAVVLPGTVSPEEMREIRSVRGIGIEIMLHMVEEFILLGKCWMPSYVHLKPTGERQTGSMKRGGVGACFRICQQPWELFDRGIRADTRFFPSRQISRLSDVAAYADAGADVLKLQGRSLPADLLASLVRRYREAIDSHAAPVTTAAGPPSLPTMWSVVGR